MNVMALAVICVSAAEAQQPSSKLCNYTWNTTTQWPDITITQGCEFRRLGDCCVCVHYITRACVGSLCWPNKTQWLWKSDST